MLKKKNITAALRMYDLRLQVLKEELSYIVAKGKASKSEELESFLIMSLIQNEVRDINLCLPVLEGLLNRYNHGNL